MAKRHDNIYLKYSCLILSNISGNDMPVSKSYFQMVSSADKKSLYAIGGASGKESGKEIYKFSCTGSINNCQWQKSNTALKYGRYSFVAIPIPNSLADKLCN